MGIVSKVALAVLLGAVSPSLASAQRFPFERSFDVSGRARVDVSTIRGKIDIVAGQPGRIVVSGDATVRVGWDAPANAIDLARQVAAAPPIQQDGATVRLRPPAEGAEQRAVTLNYQVQVPPDTDLLSSSDSGATSIRGVNGSVAVKTQSARIDVTSIGGPVTVLTGSGAVTVHGSRGAVDVTTESSAFSGIDLGASVRVRTQSGAIDLALTGTGDADVETGSSEIRLRGLGGGLLAKSQSGRISVQGTPRREWNATTGSSRVTIDLDDGVDFSIDASSRSGSVTVEGAAVTGTIAKRAVKGTVGSGGPLLRLTSGSGAIQVHVAGKTDH